MLRSIGLVRHKRRQPTSGRTAIYQCQNLSDGPSTTRRLTSAKSSRRWLQGLVKRLACLWGDNQPAGATRRRRLGGWVVAAGRSWPLARLRTPLGLVRRCGELPRGEVLSAADCKSAQNHQSDSVLERSGAERPCVQSESAISRATRLWRRRKRKTVAKNSPSRKEAAANAAHDSPQTAGTAPKGL